MPQNIEPTVNVALGSLLEGMLSDFSVYSENTNVVVKHRGRRPDILVVSPDRSPVVIETEFHPASTVEDDASKRIGINVEIASRPVESVIALRFPESLAQVHDLPAALNKAQFSYFTLTDVEGENQPRRFPDHSWLDGSIYDLAELVRLASVPQQAVIRAADMLELGIEMAARKLEDISRTRSGITAEMADLLGLRDLPQTRRMACAIIANAMLFHDHIAGMHSIKLLDVVCGAGVVNLKAAVTKSWGEILAIDYFPIFAIASTLVAQIPTRQAPEILRPLQETAANVAATGVTNAHDLTGRLFQRLIVDRKYLATFYTLPASAALLARLAVDKLEGVNWGSLDAVADIRVGDFACGTGALLSAVYEQFAVKYESEGGDLDKLHPVMIENVLRGCDIVPSAIHITSSTLSGVRPNVGYSESHLYKMPYGRRDDGEVRIGSLELLLSADDQSLFHVYDSAKQTVSTGEEEAHQLYSEVMPHAGFDLVIMNPPFTRATNHEGRHACIVNPAFAAFGADRGDQKDMGARVRKIARAKEMGRATCYDGNAGIDTAFAELAHRKLKPGGVLALVLPLSVASGLSWKKLRRLLATYYSDLTVLSIAANGMDMSFSSDTGMADCLIVARKRRPLNPNKERSVFISLHQRPKGFADAYIMAREIMACNSVRKIEDGPYDGTALLVGNGMLEKIGNMITVPNDGEGGNWGAVRTLDYSLAQTAYALSQSKLWLPSLPTKMELNTVQLSEFGRLGLVDRDINGSMPRGPFEKARPSSTSTYPALWNHNARAERRIVCNPDSQLVVRQGMEEKAAKVWETASRVHFNRDFTFGSQPLAVAFTERKSIGGRVWPNVIFEDDRFDYAFAMWGNSTLGLLSYWWHSSRQQSSKAGITIRAAESLVVPDFRFLSDAQLQTAQDIFDDFRNLELKPASQADNDENRELLDRRVLRDLLGFEEETFMAVRRLATKWCAEPSVHGAKGQSQKPDVLDAPGPQQPSLFNLF